MSRSKRVFDWSLEREGRERLSILRDISEWEVSWRGSWTGDERAGGVDGRGCRRVRLRAYVTSGAIAHTVGLDDESVGR